MIAFPRTVSAAVGYLAEHPELCADKTELLCACAAWTETTILRLQADSSVVPITHEVIATAMQQAGLCAVKEVAMPVKKTEIDNLIEPEDLQ